MAFNRNSNGKVLGELFMKLSLAAATYRIRAERNLRIIVQKAMDAIENFLDCFLVWTPRLCKDVPSNSMDLIIINVCHTIKRH